MQEGACLRWAKNTAWEDNIPALCTGRTITTNEKSSVSSQLLIYFLALKYGVVASKAYAKSLNHSLTVYCVIHVC